MATSLIQRKRVVRYLLPVGRRLSDFSTFSADGVRRSGTEISELYDKNNDTSSLRHNMADCHVLQCHVVWRFLSSTSVQYYRRGNTFGTWPFVKVEQTRSAGWTTPTPSPKKKKRRKKIPRKARAGTKFFFPTTGCRRRVFFFCFFLFLEYTACPFWPAKKKSTFLSVLLFFFSFFPSFFSRMEKRRPILFQQ